MKRNIIIVLIVLIVLAVFVGVIKYGSNMKYQNDLQAIEDSRNSSLDTYNENKNIAKLYLKLYSIRDNSSYQSVKTELFDYLSPVLQKEHFSKVNYEGPALHKTEIEVLSVKASNNPPKEENTVIITYNLSGVNYNQDITNLITIKDGVIQKVVRIK